MAERLRSKILLEMISELLNRAYTVRFRANGRSMHPTIKDGEVITVAPVVPPDVKMGDIIVYGFERGVIAHRVVGIERRNGDAPLFILRGDGSGSCDEPVGADQVLGKVVSVKRDGRGITLDSRRAKLLHSVRVCASRLKRWIHPRVTPIRKGGAVIRHRVNMKEAPKWN